MSAFDHATQFFHACESAQGWAGCREHVADGASFHSGAASYQGMDTVEAYCEQVAGAFATTFKGSTYRLLASAYDADSTTAFFHGLSCARHTGEGGPVPPTQREAEIPFIYVMKMNAEGKLEHLEKVYDEASGRRQLGWPTE